MIDPRDKEVYGDGFARECDDEEESGFEGMGLDRDWD